MSEGLAFFTCLFFVFLVIVSGVTFYALGLAHGKLEIIEAAADDEEQP